MENKEILDGAYKLIAEEKFKEAAEILEKTETQDVEAKKNLALCYVNLDDYERALVLFEKVKKEAPDDATSLFYLANCYDKTGFEDKAIDEYKKVIELREGFLDAYKSLALIYLKQGHQKKIIDLLTPLTEVECNDYVIYYMISTAYISLDKRDKAITYLKKAIELNPEHIQMQNNLANCYIGLNKLDEAREILKKALEQDTKNAATNYNLGVLSQILGDYESALEYFNVSYQTDPSVSLLVTLAYCAKRVQKYDMAAELYKSLTALYPDNANYQSNLVDVLMEKKDYKGALKSVQNLLKFNPKSTDLLKKYAMLLRLLGSWEYSCEILESLIKRGKVDIEIYYNYAISLFNMEELEEAKEAFRKCIALEPDNPYVHKDLGVLYLKMNFVDWAKEELETAINAEPNDPEINFAYAVFLNKTNQYKEADNYYQKAIEGQEDNPDYYAHRGENLIMQGMQEDGVKNLHTALKIDPKNYIALFNLSKVYFAQKKYKIAQGLLEDMIDIIKNDPEVLNMLAICKMKLKDFEGAIGIFENLRKKYPKNHILLANLGNCYLKIEEFDKAKEAANEALKMFSDFDDALKILKEVERHNEQ